MLSPPRRPTACSAAASIVLGCLTTLVSPLQLASQAGDIERVGLVLGSPVVYRALPFDEPFYLTGKTGPLIDSVAVWLVNPRTGVDCVTFPEEASVSAWRRIPSVPSDSFYVRMGELPPNRSFTMCVRTRGRPSATMQAELLAGWRGAIDSAFRAHASAPPPAEPSPPWTPDASQLTVFQRVLLDRLGPGVEPKPGSLLDSSVGPEGFARGLPATRRISSAQYERDLAIRDLVAAADRAGAALGRVRANPALPMLMAIRAPTNSALRAFHSVNRSGLEAAVALLVRTPTQLKTVSRGETPLVSATTAPLARRESLSAVWDAAALEPRVRSLAQTVEQSSALFGAVRALGANPPLRDLAGVSAADLEQLDSDLFVALNELASVQNHLGVVVDQLSDRSDAIAEAANALVVHERATIAVETHTHYDVKTTARNHVSADFGAIYLWDLQETTPVLGANFYFRPVNRDRGPGGNALRRFSLSIGLTTSSLAKDGERTDLFGSFNVAIGVGARVTRLLRLSAGGVVFNSVDADSSVSGSAADTTLKVTPYLAATLDFVVKDLLSSLLGKIF